MSELNARLAGWLAEFDSGPAACAAALALREQGYRRLDLHTPYEIPAARQALGLERPRYLPRATAIGALIGGLSGYGIQWYSSVAFPHLVAGGRPIHAPPAFVPVTFELAVLGGAFAACFGLLWRRPLLRLWQPLFEVEGFERASSDRHWLRVEADDPRFVVELTREELEALGALRVEPVPAP